MQESLLIVEKRDLVCTITLNRPEYRNALSDQLLGQLIEVMDNVNSDPLVRVVVIRGAGDQIFSSGYDIRGIQPASKDSAEKITEEREAPQRENMVRAAAESISRHRCPVIAMIYGAAMGAGVELAASCDLRMAADTAKFAVTPAKIGICYPLEGIWRFVGLMGVAATKELLFTGAPIDAKRAKEIGLINQVVEAKQLESVTYRLASQIANNAPLSVRGLKKLTSKLVEKPLLSPEDWEESNAVMTSCLHSYDLQEGIRAFMEKRPPKFEGR